MADNKRNVASKVSCKRKVSLSEMKLVLVAWMDQNLIISCRMAREHERAAVGGGGGRCSHAVG